MTCTMQLEKLGTCVFLAVYSCFVVYVPTAPSLYRLTVDVFSSILSLTACIILQAFIASGAQKTLLGGLCIQFLFTQEADIIRSWILSLVANTMHEGLTTFYFDYPEIAKYLLSPKTIPSGVSASLLTLSAARLALIASPAYFQGINRTVCLRVSAVFIFLTVLADLMINHVRCLVKHSKHYKTISVSVGEQEVGISDQMFNHSTLNTIWTDHTECLDCFELTFPVILLCLSFVIESIKIGVFYFRLLKKNKRTVPLVESANNEAIQLSEKTAGNSSQVNKKTTSVPKRSYSTGDINIQNFRKTEKHRPSLQPSTIQTVLEWEGALKPSVRFPLMVARATAGAESERSLRNDNLIAAFSSSVPPRKIPTDGSTGASTVSLKKMVIKPFKDFLFRTSILSFVLSIVLFFVLIHLHLKFDSSSIDNSFTVLSGVVRIIVLVMPIMSVLFDEQVLTYVKGLIM